MEQNKKNSLSTEFWNQVLARREMLSQGLRGAGIAALGSTLYPLQSLATVFNAGSFWRKRTVSGTLWGWGWNTEGEIGDGTNVKKSSPVQIGSLNTWTQVVTAKYHTLAMKLDGTLWGWGDNSIGSLGFGALIMRSSPVQISTLTDWIQISAGYWGHSAGIRANGTLWTWGANSSGQLGNGTTTNTSSPIQVGALTDWAQVSCGQNFIVAIKKDGTLWCWGSNGFGTLGQNNTVAAISSPLQIGTLKTWVQISAGYEHVLALKSDGSLWAWGNSTFGQTGLGSTVHKSSPVQIGALTDWAKLSAGVYHSYALKTNGTFWAWGDNYAGQVPDGTTVKKSSPVQIGALTDWVQVGGGYNYGLGVRANGTLWAFGDQAGLATDGTLGLGDLTNRSSPTQVGALTTWVKLGTGAKIFALKAN